MVRWQRLARSGSASHLEQRLISTLDRFWKKLREGKTPTPTELHELSTLIKTYEFNRKDLVGPGEKLSPKEKRILHEVKNEISRLLAKLRRASIELELVRDQISNKNGAPLFSEHYSERVARREEILRRELLPVKPMEVKYVPRLETPSTRLESRISFDHLIGREINRGSLLQALSISPTYTGPNGLPKLLINLAHRSVVNRLVDKIADATEKSANFSSAEIKEAVREIDLPSERLIGDQQENVTVRMTFENERAAVSVTVENTLSEPAIIKALTEMVKANPDETVRQFIEQAADRESVNAVAAVIAQAPEISLPALSRLAVELPALGPAIREVVSSEPVRQAIVNTFASPATDSGVRQNLLAEPLVAREIEQIVQQLAAEGRALSRRPTLDQEILTQKGTAQFRLIAAKIAASDPAMKPASVLELSAAVAQLVNRVNEVNNQIRPEPILLDRTLAADPRHADSVRLAANRSIYQPLPQLIQVKQETSAIQQACSAVINLVATTGVSLPPAAARATSLEQLLSAMLTRPVSQRDPHFLTIVQTLSTVVLLYGTIMRLVGGKLELVDKVIEYLKKKRLEKRSRLSKVIADIKAGELDTATEELYEAVLAAVGLTQSPQLAKAA
jgi:hypothetical protein